MSLNVSSLLLGCIDEKIRVVEDTPGVEAFMRIPARAFVTLASHVFLLFFTLCLLLRHLCQAVRICRSPIEVAASIILSDRERINLDAAWIF